MTVDEETAECVLKITRAVEDYDEATVTQACFMVATCVTPCHRYMSFEELSSILRGCVLARDLLLRAGR